MQHGFYLYRTLTHNTLNINHISKNYNTQPMKHSVYPCEILMHNSCNTNTILMEDIESMKLKYYSYGTLTQNHET